jgi:hypothetical protein
MSVLKIVSFLTFYLAEAVGRAHGGLPQTKPVGSELRENNGRRQLAGILRIQLEQTTTRNRCD